MIQTYTAEQMQQTLANLRQLFDVVRLVDPLTATLEPEGTALTPGSENACYQVWNGRSERCQNCVSLRAVREGQRQTKYEFSSQEVFYVVSAPVQVDGRILALEIVHRVSDPVLFNAYGPSEFVNRITAFNAQMHLDPGTDLFNRRYLEEKLYLLSYKAALNKTDFSVALMDVDGYEHVAAHFGPSVADEAILAIGRLLSSNVSHRRGDFVARHGPHTFALAFDNIPRLLLRDRLIALVQRVTNLRLMGYEDVRLNVSVGVWMYSDRDAAQSPEEMLAVATRRMELAHGAGFNRIAFSDG
ncbi:MAG: GGDEF domain-containing protein [Candidatus Limiplasma sp.]|nr:GGDEF domain-containing protein [Candidatus Limiplasma sp.]